jgi:hypothetical protein
MAGLTLRPDKMDNMQSNTSSSMLLRSITCHRPSILLYKVWGISCLAIISENSSQPIPGGTTLGGLQAVTAFGQFFCILKHVGGFFAF